MLANHNCHLQLVYTNMTPETIPGQAVSSGLSNAEGSWATVVTSGNVTTDIFGFWLMLIQGAGNSLIRMHLVDVGYDPAGGTSFTPIVSNIPMGSTHTFTGGGDHKYLPIFIPAGSTIGVRIQGSNSSANSPFVCVRLFGKPSHPELLRVGRYSETVGTITNSDGVAFTPGNATKGSWASLGTTTRNLWWFQLGLQANDSATTTLIMFADLAYGDGSTFIPIIQDMVVYVTNAEQKAVPLDVQGFCDVPAGSTLYVRAAASTTPDTGWNALAVGIGG